MTGENQFKRFIKYIGVINEFVYHRLFCCSCFSGLVAISIEYKKIKYQSALTKTISVLTNSIIYSEEEKDLFLKTLTK